MLCILEPRDKLPSQQVCLAEHAVQVQIAAGQEVARAETEARRDDARVSVAVDHGDVRRVTVRLDGAREDVDERQHPLGLVETLQMGETRDRLGHARQTSARRDAPRAVGDLHRIVPARLVRREVCRSEQSAALRRECKQLFRERASVERRRIGGQLVEHAGQPGLLEPRTGL